MHAKSKLFPQGILGGNGITHFKGKVPWHMGHNKPCLLMPPCIDKFSSGERHLTVSARNSAYFQSRHMHPRV